MKTIFKLTMKKAIRDPFLIFWSIFFPLVIVISLGLFFKMESYTVHTFFQNGKLYRAYTYRYELCECACLFLYDYKF